MQPVFTPLTFQHVDFTHPLACCFSHQHPCANHLTLPFTHSSPVSQWWLPALSLAFPISIAVITPRLEPGEFASSTTTRPGEPPPHFLLCPDPITCTHCRHSD